MAAESSSLKFVDSHNIVGYLLDPPAAHKEFRSMITGLNSCRISQALRASPVIHIDMITDFWKNAAINKQGADGAGTVESTVNGVKVIISEQTIREVLEFGDAPEFPTEFSADRVKEALEKMCYEGSYPPTIKKLLPPFWRFLAHTFVSCISGRKGGSDEISQTATSAFAALAMDWDYNFSRYVFEEMQSNLQQKKKDLFLMYPRFLHMIFNEKYPSIERTPNTLDVKALGPNTFGLMKQSRKAARVAYKGLKELVKFGRFSEREEASETPITTGQTWKVLSLSFNFPSKRL